MGERYLRPSHRIASEPHLGHSLCGRDLELDLELPLHEVDLGRDLATLEVDAEDVVGAAARRLVRVQHQVAAHEVQPPERLQREPLRSAEGE